MLNGPFHSFFPLLIKNSDQISIDTAGNGALKLQCTGDTPKQAKLVLHKVQSRRFTHVCMIGGTNIPPPPSRPYKRLYNSKNECVGD